MATVNLPSNSIMPDKGGNYSDNNKPKVEAVAKGQKRKESAGKKLKRSIIAEDGRSVAEYILMDVLLPAAKNTISDVVSESIQRLLFGDSGPNRHKNVRDNRSYVSYNSFYNKPRESYSHRARATHDFDEIVLASRDEADRILDSLADLISQYDVATVADLYDLAGVTSSYTDAEWGWYSIGGASPRRIREGYILDLPRPIAVNDR